MKRNVQMHPAWPRILELLKLSEERVLRGAALPTDLLRREVASVEVADYFGFWESIARTSGDPTVAIRLGKILAGDRHHPQIRAALARGNVAEGLGCIADEKRKTMPICFAMKRTEDQFVVNVSWDEPYLQIPGVLAATELVFVTQFARLGSGERICPIQIESPYALTPAAPYEAYFGVPPMLSNEHRVTFTLEDAVARFPISRVPPAPSSSQGTEPGKRPRV